MMHTPLHTLLPCPKGPRLTSLSTCLDPLAHSPIMSSSSSSILRQPRLELSKTAAAAANPRTLPRKSGSLTGHPPCLLLLVGAGRQAQILIRVKPPCECSSSSSRNCTPTAPMIACSPQVEWGNNNVAGETMGLATMANSPLRSFGLGDMYNLLGRRGSG